MKNVFELRPYQIEAAQKLHNHIQLNKIALLSAATGSGKTALVCRMINKYYFKHPGRSFLILAHKKELLNQFYSTFGKFTDIPLTDIDFCCTGIKKKCDFDKRIIIASVQTLINKINTYPGADLVIIDETHRISHDEQTQYQQLLETLRDYKPNHRVIGVTATVYRLGHGLIYGDKCRPGRVNFFPDLTHKISYKKLVQEDYLMPLKGHVAAGEKVLTELNGVKLTGGEFTMGAAGLVMGNHVESAVEAYKKYGSHHKKVAILACTISHAEQLQQVFVDAGYSTGIVHSKQKMADRNKTLHDWQHGSIDIVVSVNILVEGFDFPGLSCLLMCRPTKSPVIWVQAIGRILRKAEGKTEALLIDMTGNVHEFGLDLDNPKFTVPQSAEGEDGEAPTKICPEKNNDGSVCGLTVYAAVLVCPDCGYEWDKEAVQQLLGDMDEVEFKQAEPPKWYDVVRVDPSIHTSKQNGNQLLRIQIILDADGSYYSTSKHVSVWCCFEDYYNDNDYALEKGEEKWKQFSSENYPAGVEEAEWFFDTLREPVRVLCSEDDKGYLNALEFDFEGSIENIQETKNLIEEHEVPF